MFRHFFKEREGVSSTATGRHFKFSQRTKTGIVDQAKNTSTFQWSGDPSILDDMVHMGIVTPEDADKMRTTIKPEQEQAVRIARREAAALERKVAEAKAEREKRARISRRAAAKEKEKKALESTAAEKKKADYAAFRARVARRVASKEK